MLARVLRCGSSLGVALAFTLVVADTHAEPPPDPVVARIGEAGAVTAGALAARIAAMPSFQRFTFGSTARVVARRFLDRVVIPEQLVQIAARDAHLDQQPAVAFAVDRALAGATVRALGARVGVASAISNDDVRAYFEANRARYDAPERIRVARILCRTRDEALAVLAAAKADPSAKNFADLARDHSIDKATNLRGGDEGFLAEDGASNEPGLRVDPAIVRAARTVADGELVPHPVPEGDAFAVIARRGTIAARKRTVDDLAGAIRDAIAKDRVKSETDKLIASLRAARVKDENPAPLESVELPPLEQGQGGLGSTVDARPRDGPN